MRRIVIVAIALAALVVAAPAFADGRPLSADLAASNELNGGDVGARLGTRNPQSGAR